MVFRVTRCTCRTDRLESLDAAGNGFGPFRECWRLIDQRRRAIVINSTKKRGPESLGDAVVQLRRQQVLSSQGDRVKHATRAFFVEDGSNSSWTRNAKHKSTPRGAKNVGATAQSFRRTKWFYLSCIQRVRPRLTASRYGLRSTVMGPQTAQVTPAPSQHHEPRKKVTVVVPTRRDGKKGVKKVSGRGRHN